jgi:hypothetical protein
LKNPQASSIAQTPTMSVIDPTWGSLCRASTWMAAVKPMRLERIVAVIEMTRAIRPVCHCAGLPVGSGGRLASRARAISATIS